MIFKKNNQKKLCKRKIQAFFARLLLIFPSWLYFYFTGVIIGLIASLAINGAISTKIEIAICFIKLFL